VLLDIGILNHFKILTFMLLLDDFAVTWAYGAAFVYRFRLIDSLA